MPTIEENDKKMTIYYYKSDGTISSFCTGIQDMNFFGDRQKDMELIVDYVVVDRDDYVMRNLNMFYIVDKQLKLKENADMKKYI